MSISLRVVGIFYNNSVEAPTGSMSVRDLLDASMQNSPPGTTFTYTNVILNGINSPGYFSAEYANGVVSQTSGISYPPGTYELQEILTTRPSYTVWQYYIFSADNVFLNRGLGIIPYDQAMVADGQSVVFRLLTIAAEPTVQAPRLMQTPGKLKALSYQ